MATGNARTPEEVRHELESERERLANAVDSLRSEVKGAADVGGKLRANLPIVAAGALGVGFFLAGGVGATEQPDVGHVPRGPHRLGLHEWVDVFKRTFKEFLADDCMGLSQQIAFSSLLAFFPAMILLVGLLGLIGAYDDLKEFLGVVAPGAVIEAIDTAQESAAGQDTAASFAVVFGAFGAIWAASGA